MFGIRRPTQPVHRRPSDDGRQSDDEWWAAAAPVFEAVTPLVGRLKSCVSPEPQRVPLPFHDVCWSRADVSRLDDITYETDKLAVALDEIQPPRSHARKGIERNLQRALKQLHRAAEMGRDAAWITVEIRAKRVPRMPLGGVGRKVRRAAECLREAELRLAVVARFEEDARSAW